MEFKTIQILYNSGKISSETEYFFCFKKGEEYEIEINNDNFYFTTKQYKDMLDSYIKKGYELVDEGDSYDLEEVLEYEKDLEREYLHE